MVRRTLMVASLLLLGGCASTGMSEAECRMAEWRAVGFEDGARGLGAESIGVHRTACAEHGVAPRFDEYLAGHAQGLETYCHPQNGSELGARGHRYTGVCPEHLEGPFLDAHEQGFGLYERRGRLQDVRRRLGASRRRSNEVEHLLVEKTTKLIAPELSRPERATVAVQLKQLAEERGRLETSIRHLEIEIVEAEEEYERYRGQIAQRD